MPPAVEPPLRLKGNPYARPDYFRTDVAKGVTRTPAGLRVCALPSEFLLGFRDALIYECGKAYRKVMKAAGRRWGAKFVARFDKEMTALYQAKLRDLPSGQVQTCLADAFAANGYGRLDVDLSECDAGIITAELWDSVMPTLVREADKPVDLLMAGMIGAIFAHLTGEPLDAVQTDCPSLGADRSRFVIAHADVVAEAEEWADGLDKAPAHDVLLSRIQSAVAPSE